MPKRRPSEAPAVKNGISITAASPAARPIRNGPPPTPSILSGTNPSVADVAIASTRSPTRKGSSGGDSRKAAPIDPSREARGPRRSATGLGNRRANAA